MLTKLEIDGFKSFEKCNVALRPFQVFIGPNASGKSNLFDAIRLLSDLADSNFSTAFRNNRGEPEELFRKRADGKVSAIDLAAEMLVPNAVKDEIGNTEKLKSTRLRYEIKIERTEAEAFTTYRLIKEELRRIKKGEDIWFKNVIPATKTGLNPLTRRALPFISTENDIISLHQDGAGGRKRQFDSKKMNRSALSVVDDASAFPHVYNVKKEMKSWRQFHFDPSALREPTPRDEPPVMAENGANLAGLLYKLETEDHSFLKDISLELSATLGEIFDIKVCYEKEKKTYLVSGISKDGTEFSSRILSDGTLRLLALTAIKFDPDYQGVFMFEEPENGVHPGRLKYAVDVLRSIASNFKKRSNGDFPLKQILINSHSPVLLSYLGNEEVYYVSLVDSIGPGGKTTFTRLSPVSSKQLTLLPAEPVPYVARDEIISVLLSGDGKAVDRFKEG